MPVAATSTQIGLLALYIVAGSGIAFFLQRTVARHLRGRTKAEDLLRTSQAQMASILTIAADAIITIDETQSIVHFNHGAEQIFGYTSAEMVGQPLELLLPQASRGMHRGHVTRFAESNEQARRMAARREVAGRRRNGKEFPAEASISKLPTARGMLLCVVLRDVSEQKRREEHEHLLAVTGARLAGSLEYEETLRVIPDLVVPVLGEWCVLDVIEKPSGAPRTIRRIASGHHDPRRGAALQLLESRGLDWDSPSAVIDVLRTRDPLLLPAVDASWIEAHSDQPESAQTADALDIQSLIIVPLLARDEVFGALTIGRPIDRPAFDEADLNLARAVAFRAALAVDNAIHFRSEQRATLARDEMLAIVSHDLRNPANAIAMCAKALSERPPDSPSERQALIGTIAESAEWMRRLMQDLVDVASIEAGRLSVTPEPLDVRPLVTATMEMFAERAHQGGVTLDADVPAEVPMVLADASRLKQVLANLLDNAVKFTPKGGRIDLGVTVGLDEVQFTVRDTGSGILAEYLPMLFDRFWHARGTSHTHGSGLGLAIARGIVQAHGGRIWVDTKAGSGSSFHFTVPRSA